MGDTISLDQIPAEVRVQTFDEFVELISTFGDHKSDPFGPAHQLPSTTSPTKKWAVYLHAPTVLAMSTSTPEEPIPSVDIEINWLRMRDSRTLHDYIFYDNGGVSVRTPQRDVGSLF